MLSALTAIIAAVVAIIAFLQWRTAREKVLLDLFDRRYGIYTELTEVIHTFQRHARIEFSDLSTYVRAQSRAQFFFDEDVLKFLHDRRQDLIRADHANKPGYRPADGPPGDGDPLLDRLNRLTDFDRDLDALVAPYMNHRQRAFPHLQVKAVSVAARLRRSVKRYWPSLRQTHTD